MHSQEIIESSVENCEESDTGEVSGTDTSVESDTGGEPETSDQSDACDESETAPVKSQEDEFDRGVVFYLKNQRVVGVLMWNVFRKSFVARQVCVKNTCFITCIESVLYFLK